MIRNTLQPTYKNIVRSLLLNSLVDSIEDGSVTIPDGSHTRTAAAIINEGQTTRLYPRSILRNLPDADFPHFLEWADLAITGATAVFQHDTPATYSFSNPDIGNDDLSTGFTGYRTWNDEVDTRSDIGSETGWWYVRDETQFVGRSTAGGALVTLSGPEYLFAIGGTGITWLGHRTFANAQTGYAETGTTFYYDTGNNQVRRLQRTVLTAGAWNDMVSGTEYDDVTTTELTLDTSTLLSDGTLSASLVLNAISEDKDDLFRIAVEITDGTATYTLYLPIDLENIPDAVTLPSGSATLTSRDLTEGESLSLDLREDLDELDDTDFPALSVWSQLLIDSASAGFQKYSEGGYEKEDIGDSDLADNRIWHGVYATNGDAGTPFENGVYYNIAELDLVYAVAIVGGFQWTIVSAPSSFLVSHGSGSAIWLTATTDAELDTYFTSNTYNADNSYYHYDSVSETVRRITDVIAEGWSDFGATDEVDGVSGTELTRNTDSLLSNGELTVSLSENSVDEDKDDLFRVKIDFVSGDTTFTVYQPIDLENVVEASLSDLDAFATADAETFREAQSERFIDLEDVLGISAGTWENYNIDSAGVVVQHSSDSGANWANIGVTGFQGLLPTEYTLNTTESVSAHRFGFRIHNNVIESDILADATNRLRFLVTIEDDNMAMIERSIPFTAESRISLSSFPATTNATARTVREGGTADAVSLTSLLSLITDWDDVHWDTGTTAVIQQSEDEGASWETQTAEFEGLAISERTLTTDDLLANGNLSLALGADTLAADIPHDAENRLRVYVTLVSGDVTRYISIPYNFRAPESLSDLTTFLTATAQTFREGSAAATLEYTTLFSDITDIDDYNIHEATLIVQYSDDSGVNWHPMGALGFQGLLPTEYTLTTSNLESALEWMFNIHNNVISDPIEHDGTNRLRFLLTIEGD